MCWCWIRLVLQGLLGLLCVVHVVSGKCGEDFTSTAMASDVVIQGKVVNVSNADRETKLFYAKISIKNPVLKGKKIIKKMPKDDKILTLGPFKKKQDLKHCFGSVKKGRTYIFLLESRSNNIGVQFNLKDLPKRRTRKLYKDLKGQLCKAEKNCKSKSKKGKKSSKPQIKLLDGPKDTIETGSKLTFKCKAKGKPTPVYTWYKDGVELRKRRGLTIVNKSKYSRLLIKRSTQKDEGKYRCVAKNAVGSAQQDWKPFSIRENPKTHRNDTSLCKVQTLCLNGGTCLKNEALDINYCVCRTKWTGTRCEVMSTIKIHGHYNRQATILYERNLIILGLVITVLVFIAICIASYFLAKRKRKKFEARKKRKQLLRANASNAVRMKDSATQSYGIDENFHPGHNNAYQPIAHDSRGFSPGRDNGFDFEAAQRQPLLRHHGPDDVDGSGPESRRRLVASSMYDNFDDLPTTIPTTTTTTPNRSSNITGLTTAEVSQNPEMIEMSSMEPSRAAGPGGNNDDDTSHHRQPRPPMQENDVPYPLPSEDSTTPLSQSSPVPNHHRLPKASSFSPTTEIHQQPSPYDPSLPPLPPPPSTQAEELDFEKYRAPPPPILPLSHSNSTPLRHTPPPNSTNAPIAADPSRFPSSNSMPIRLVNNIDSNNDIANNGDHDNDHSSLPTNHTTANNPYANFPSSNEAPRQPHQSPLSKASDDSPPSYDTALRNGIASDDDDDDDDDDSDDGIPNHFQNGPSNAIEDLHIDEDYLALSAENLPRGSFDSSARQSRQPSVDTEGLPDYDNRNDRRRRFSIEKQQSEDIIHPEPFWKRAMLYGQSPRSQSLDVPSSTEKHNGTGPPHLDSTVSEKHHDSPSSNSSSRYHNHHPDDVFDPNDNSTPWDPDQQHQSCNSNYTNLLDDERDRLNRLKDVCPDQPAIPI